MRRRPPSRRPGRARWLTFATCDEIRKPTVRPSYDPLLLIVDVLAVLERQGIPLSVPGDPAVRAAVQLLRSLGVEPSDEHGTGDKP